MGSGETSPTMVKTHRGLLQRVRSGASGDAVLLDTPFGFQSNADDLASRACQYFDESVGVTLEVASFRSASEVGSAGYELALAALRRASYVFAGPGSPTYALRTWRASSVPALLAEKVSPGGGAPGCVTFASAAALTVGIATVPVYEIYKVGADPYWEEGLDLLGAGTGLRAAVIPHFNNAEGGTHDTRFCYLGEDRLSAMERTLPDGSFVLGVDEHTGLVLDLDEGRASVVGVGTVTVRRPGGRAEVVESGAEVSIDDLTRMATGEGPGSGSRASARQEPRVPRSERASLDSGAGDGESPLLRSVRDAEAAFDAALVVRDADGAVQVVLDLEAELHAWANETFSSDEMDRARAALRSMIVRLGAAATSGVRDPREVVAPFVDALLGQRASARADRRFADADAVRDLLAALGIEVRDTATGSEWEIHPSG
ncbi:MAG TPA: hypothetical protein VF230_09130 [Acidimicrobiales bacterium]